jgi:hypothetical protein
VDRRAGGRRAEGLADAEATTVFGGDDRVGVKDPVIRVADAAGGPGSAAIRWRSRARRTA